MTRLSDCRAGWRAISLIAITYVYFLIFAQFAFLQRLADLGIANAHLKPVMAAMAFGGILLSLFTPRTKLIASPIRRMQTALFLCATAALLTLLPLGLSGSIVVAFLIGSGLGLLTVTLVTHLQLWLGGPQHALLQVALGTGLGYLICNFPPLFTASPKLQSLTAATLCLAALWIAIAPIAKKLPEPQDVAHPQLSFPRVLASFTALIWLDSAAFYIIQNTPALKSGTWQGTAHLLLNGLLHLSAAITCAWLLRRRGLSVVLSLAFSALAVACLLLLDANRVVLASIFYPIGVSLYSVALVAYPSLLATADSPEDRGRKAGWIYAVAGWCGSALGIGMAQNLGRVPPHFVIFAAIVILAVPCIELYRQRTRELLTCAGVLLLAFFLYRTSRLTSSPHVHPSSIERGRQVYISEGCINCHSQYVRPHTSDVLLWGPVQTLEELRLEHPPLIGNRRQGPDLSQVGSRRSALWLKAHFYNPSEVSHASFMPSYVYLFQNGDDRGQDLIDYLQSLHSGRTEQHLIAERAWQPAASTWKEASASDGARLFQAYCATCHTTSGATRRTWQQSFRRIPPDLAIGPILHLERSESTTERRTHLAQIVKFGIAGTDMPGHEYLSDKEVSSLSLWLTQIIPSTDSQLKEPPETKQ